MNAEPLKSLQGPLKEQYWVNPASAPITLRASGRARLVTFKGPAVRRHAGIHCGSVGGYHGKRGWFSRRHVDVGGSSGHSSQPGTDLTLTRSLNIQRLATVCIARVRFPCISPPEQLNVLSCFGITA